jgi:peptidoglycan/LPS O-acetylase OafA/YrhL
MSNSIGVEKGSNGRHELVSIELLRGLAAAAVLVFHAYRVYWRGRPPVFWSGSATESLRNASLADMLALPFGLGFLGVNLFFILSGFCIHLPHIGRPRVALSSFAVRRFFRLYPPYIVVVLGCFVLTWAKHGFLAGEASLPNLLGHMVFWYYAVPADNAAMGVSPVFWTIAIEVQFYVIYVAVLPLIHRYSVTRCAIAWLVLEVAYIVAWRALDVQANGWLRTFEPHRFGLARFGEWLLGAWIAEYWTATSRHRHVGLLGAAALLAVGIGGVIASATLCFAGIFDELWLDIPVAASCTMLVLGAVFLEDCMYPREGRSVVHWILGVGKWLGSRSYSLYLVHFTVLVTAVELAARLGGVHDKMQLRGSGLMGVTVAIGVSATLVLVEFGYRLIERPSHALGRRLATVRST